MIFSHPTESIQYNPYILDIPIGKNKDALEDIFTDLLELDEGEIIYIKRDGNKYRVTHKDENSITGYYENSLIFSIGDTLEFSEDRYSKNMLRGVRGEYRAKHICNARIRFANAFGKSIKVTEDTIKNKEIMIMARDYLQVMSLGKDEDYESTENDNR